MSRTNGNLVLTSEADLHAASVVRAHCRAYLSRKAMLAGHSPIYMPLLAARRGNKRGGKAGDSSGNGGGGVVEGGTLKGGMYGADGK
jgi:hypothetical protein